MRAADKFIQGELEKAFANIRRKNPRYSLRAFARKLNVSPATLSLFLRGNSNLSSKNLIRISKLLGVDDRVKRFESSRKSRTKPINASFLRDSQKLLLKDWTALCFLNLMKTKDFTHDIPWISQRMGISQSKVRKLIKSLLAAELIVGSTTSYRRSKEFLKTTDGVKDKTIQEFHLRTLQLAMRKLKSTALDHREFQSLTFPFPVDQIPKLKEAISVFLNKISQLSKSQTSCSDVVSLSLQVFPLTVVKSDSSDTV